MMQRPTCLYNRVSTLPSLRALGLSGKHWDDWIGRAEIAHEHVVHLHELQHSRHGQRTNLPCTAHWRSVGFRAGLETFFCRYGGTTMPGVKQASKRKRVT